MHVPDILHSGVDIAVGRRFEIRIDQVRGIVVLRADAVLAVVVRDEDQAREIDVLDMIVVIGDVGSHHVRRPRTHIDREEFGVRVGRAAAGAEFGVHPFDTREILERELGAQAVELDVDVVAHRRRGEVVVAEVDEVAVGGRTASDAERPRDIRAEEGIVAVEEIGGPDAYDVVVGIFVRDPVKRFKSRIIPLSETGAVSECLVVGQLSRETHVVGGQPVHVDPETVGQEGIVALGVLPVVQTAVRVIGFARHFVPEVVDGSPEIDAELQVASRRILVDIADLILEVGQSLGGIILLFAVAALFVCGFRFPAALERGKLLLKLFDLGFHRFHAIGGFVRLKVDTQNCRGSNGKDQWCSHLYSLCVSSVFRN